MSIETVRKIWQQGWNIIFWKKALFWSLKVRSFENSLPRYVRRKSSAKNFCSILQATTWRYQTHGLYTPTLLPTPMHNCLWCLVKISTPKLKNLSTALDTIPVQYCKNVLAEVFSLWSPHSPRKTFVLQAFHSNSSACMGTRLNISWYSLHDMKCGTYLIIQCLVYTPVKKQLL